MFIYDVWSVGIKNSQLRTDNPPAWQYESCFVDDSDKKWASMSHAEPGLIFWVISALKRSLPDTAFVV